MPTGIIGVIKRIYWVIKGIRNPWVFALDYLGLIKKKMIVYSTRSGVKVWARPGTADKSEIALIFSNKEYPEKFFPKRKNLVVLDIGSHIGLFSLFLKKKIESLNPNIFAIEPDPENFSLLKKNIELNHFEGIKCFNLAIGNWNGIGHIDKRKLSDAFVVERNISLELKKYYRQCQVLTLERFCKQNKIKKIDLLKIDCEGMEHEIFKDSIKFIKKNIRTIFLEVHDLDQERNYLNFEKYISSQGFLVKAKMFPTVAFLENTSLK